MSEFETKVTDNEETPPGFVKTDELEATGSADSEETGPDANANGEGDGEDEGETEPEVTQGVTPTKRGRRTKGEKTISARTKSEQEAGRKAIAARTRLQSKKKGK